MFFKTRNLLAASLLLLIMVFSPSAVSVQAGERVLSNNRGDASATWFITGEQTLVMNGFDLTPLALPLPAVIDRVSIAVDTPVANTPIDVVVYQDANGGSPVDAVLAGQTQVTINQAGVFTATLPTPVTITQPVVWVGFFLPVNFKFQADTSGTSVLTYWAWTPGGRFDLASLSSAQVLGPANGSAPVNIDMKGIARITAEITGGNSGQGTPLPTTIAGTPGAVVTAVPGGTADLSVLRAYPPACDTLFKDTADVNVTYRGSVDAQCVSLWLGYAPPNPVGYIRKQLLFDLTIYTDKGAPVTDKLALPITHCIQPSPEDLQAAVIGIAYGAPRKWEILPSLRVGNLVCAEIYRSGVLSYFVPG